MAKKFEKEYLVEAHRFCINNEPRLRGDSKCGCFSCISIFHPQEIKEWIDGNETPFGTWEVGKSGYKKNSRDKNVY